MTLLTFFLACSKPSAEPSEARASVEHKDGAPVLFQVEPSTDSSRIAVTFTQDARQVRVMAWGVSGLTVDGERERWAGTVEAGQVVRFDLVTSGSGDLALRAEGVFAGQRLDQVRSFTVGDRQPTPVPTDGKGSKGWDATRR